MVVSPDGMLQNNTSEQNSLAIELKCPLPGKKFTNDVHYDIPDRYISQLLSEISFLKCYQLFHLCYTPESTTVYQVRDQKMIPNYGVSYGII